MFCSEGFSLRQIINIFFHSGSPLKDKLIAWYKDEEESRINKCKKKFKNEKLKKGKSLYLFTTRLVTIYKTAYPNQDPEMSNILSDQFKTCVSRKAKGAIKDHAISASSKGTGLHGRWWKNGLVKLMLQNLIVKGLRIQTSKK